MPQSYEGTKFIIYFIYKALRNKYFVSLCLSGYRSELNINTWQNGKY